MVDASWAFLKDPANREVLAWIGAGLVAVSGGLWAVVKFFAKKGDDGPSAAARRDRGTRADRGSAAIGGDNTNSPINIGTRRSIGTPRSGKR